MNRLQSIGLSLLAGMCFSLASCGNNTSSSDQSKTDTTSSATTTSTAPSTSSTIVSTPQNILVVMHKVANYWKWKPGYDSHDSIRQAYGLHNFVIGRGVQDSNMVVVALKADDTAKAMAFLKDPSLKQAMQKGGVTGTPKVHLVTEEWQDTANIDTKLRSVVMFDVKDWATWLKNLQSGEQERKDNGIALRNYGHEANSTTKVRVVTALVDSAKAMAYYSSDLLKKRMDSSGVISKPERFIYRIVQKY